MHAKYIYTFEEFHMIAADECQKFYCNDLMSGGADGGHK